MAEWSKAVVLKAIVYKYRGFESLFARKKNVYYNYNDNYSLCFKNTVQQNNLNG